MSAARSNIRPLAHAEYLIDECDWSFDVEYRVLEDGHPYREWRDRAGELQCDDGEAPTVAIAHVWLYHDGERVCEVPIDSLPKAVLRDMEQHAVSEATPEPIIDERAQADAAYDLVRA